MWPGVALRLVVAALLETCGKPTSSSTNCCHTLAFSVSADVVKVGPSVEELRVHVCQPAVFVCLKVDQLKA